MTSLRFFSVVLGGYMKAITCEMCGGHDLIKSEGLYVCQSCGTKYSPDDAVKLVVEISGPITIDRTSDLQNYVILARRAINSSEPEKAKKYYDEVLHINANCWEAELFSLVFSSINNGSPLDKRSLILKTLVKVLDDTKQNIESDKQKEILRVVFNEINFLSVYLNKCVFYICYSIKYGGRKNKKHPEYEEFLNSLQMYKNHPIASTSCIERYEVAVSFIEYSVDVFETYGKQVFSLFGSYYKPYVLSAFKRCLKIYNKYYETVEGLNVERRNSIIEFLCKNDPSMEEYIRNENLEKLDKMIDYFGEKKQRYDEIDALKKKIIDIEKPSLQEITIEQSREKDNAIWELEVITATLQMYYQEFGNCEVQFDDSNPVVLEKLKEIIVSGKASSIQEAVKHYHSIC